MREKLIEAVGSFKFPIEICGCTIGEYIVPYSIQEPLVDHLIANLAVISNSETTTDKDTYVPSNWIPVTERLPSKEEYTAKAEDGTEYYVRLLIAHKTDIVEYEIGYYDGYKWMTEMPIRLIKDVVAWMPFPNLPQPPKGE